MADPFSISSDQLANFGFNPQQLASMQAGTFNFGQNSGAGGAAGGLAGNNAFGAGLGMNVGTGQLALGGLSTLGNLWTAWNATDLANKQFKFNSQLASDNYTNQAQAYNTNLTDRESARGAMENLSPGQVAAYNNANSLKTTM